jgi:hypothetical protein
MCFMTLRRLLEAERSIDRAKDWDQRFGHYTYHAAVAAGRLRRFQEVGFGGCGRGWRSCRDSC